MEKDLNICLVGTGWIGKSHILRINSRLKGGKVVAVSDVNSAAGKAAAEAFGCEYVADPKAMIASKAFDAVIVTTADAAHAEYTTAAIRAGKFVFTEKPLAPDRENCRKVIEAEMEGGRMLVQVGFMRRYDPGYRQLKKMLASGQYGAPLLLHCAHRNPDVPDDYTTPMEVENSMIHEIDVLRWLLGEDYATAEVACGRKTRHAGPQLQDPQVMILTTKSGVRIDVEMFAKARYGYDIKCEIVCEEGILNLPEPAFAMVRTNMARVTPIAKDWGERFPEAFDIEFQEWIDATAAGRVDGPNSWDGYMGAIAASCASRARDTGTVVRIDGEPMPEFYRKGAKG